jgi:amidohydrolase
MTNPAPVPAPPPGRPAWAEPLDAWLAEHHDELVALRRHLHAHPELGNQEHATTELLVERLTVAGLDPRVLSTGTGLVCDIDPEDGVAGSRSEVPRAALRADIDALPLQDLKDVPYRSLIPGVAHACGHDVHTTVVLGAGLFLARHRHLLARPVRLLFQPAEEVIPGGALELVRNGALDGVDLVLGLHCEPKLPVGQLGLRPGAITSAADALEITLEGPGGHTARPHLTVDLVRVASDIVLRLPGLVDEALGDVGSALVVFGSIQSGDAGNVIPTRAVLRGTVRTQSAAVWERLGPLVEKAVATIADAAGAGHQTAYKPGVPPVENDPDVIARVAAVAQAVLGPGAIAETPQSWGGDDFSYLTRQAPGAYLRLGVRSADEQGPPLDLHAGSFDVDESAIAIGVRTLVGAVLWDEVGSP